MATTTAPADATPLRSDAQQTEGDAAQQLVPRKVAPLDAAAAAALLQAPPSPRWMRTQITAPSSGPPPNEADERDQLLSQAVDLQETVRGLIERIELYKTEHRQQQEQNAVLLKYINNLVEAEKVN
ncbi:hypothetical protein HK405_010622 [Cladochytrium tenue]|nr:hypothetical protein HK405_010622 [Cladochytrium tenue]